MRFEVSFNEELYNSQCELNFNLVWKMHLKNYQKILFYGVGSSLVGTIALLNKYYFGFIFLAIGFHFLINYFNYRKAYKEAKNNFFQAVKKYKQESLEAGKNQIWEFSEEGFRFSDFGHDILIKWNRIFGFRVVDDNLFIDLEESKVGSAYILGESEIGKENFGKLVEFLDEKITKTNNAK